MERILHGTDSTKQQHLRVQEEKFFIMTRRLLIILDYLCAGLKQYQHVDLKNMLLKAFAVINSIVFYYCCRHPMIAWILLSSQHTTIIKNSFIPKQRLWFSMRQLDCNMGKEAVAFTGNTFQGPNGPG